MVTIFSKMSLYYLLDLIGMTGLWASCTPNLNAYSRI